MSESLLSRENAPVESRDPAASGESDPETEFRQLEKLLQGEGDEKLVDAYFRCVPRSC